MKFVSDDGREFSNASDCMAYEAKLKEQKAKEEAERKKAEEESAARQKVRREEFENIEKQVDILNELAINYCKKYNVNIFYSNQKGKLKPLEDYWSFYNAFNDLFKY